MDFLDNSKFRKQLDAARRRGEELGKQVAPLRAALDQADDEHKALQRELITIRTTLAQFTAGEVELTDGQFWELSKRVDLLTVRTKRAGELRAVAYKAHDKAASEARSELRQLRSAALVEFDTDVKAARLDLDRQLLAGLPSF